MTPISFLLTVLLILVLGLVLNQFHRMRLERSLRALAKRWQMQYSPADNLNLVQRANFPVPVPGAADVQVRDVIYATEGNQRQYIFTADFSRGVLYRKFRSKRAAGCCELCDKGGLSHWTWAPEDLPLLQQYEWLRNKRHVVDVNQ